MAGNLSVRRVYPGPSPSLSDDYVEKSRTPSSWDSSLSSGITIIYLTRYHLHYCNFLQCSHIFLAALLLTCCFPSLSVSLLASKLTSHVCFVLMYTEGLPLSNFVCYLHTDIHSTSFITHTHKHKDNATVIISTPACNFFNIRLSFVFLSHHYRFTVTPTVHALCIHIELTHSNLL